jgi:hypothetical protein
LREFASKLHGESYVKHFLYNNLYEVTRFLCKALKKDNVYPVAHEEVREIAIRLASFLRQKKGDFLRDLQEYAKYYAVEQASKLNNRQKETLDKFIAADATDEKSIDSNLFRNLCQALNCFKDLNILSSSDEQALKCASEGICLLLWHTMKVYGFFSSEQSMQEKARLMRICLSNQIECDCRGTILIQKGFVQLRMGEIKSSDIGGAVRQLKLRLLTFYRAAKILETKFGNDPINDDNSILIGDIYVPSDAEGNLPEYVDQMPNHRPPVSIYLFRV